ncbi:arylamine N-acetyltransferase [Saccharothrix sp. ALI-22-I]|uniref:arylamine N-acetyltransferase family protein n=1 Tax=Saccharothrix sp. ALI-22-I TaxID=1933778 RepID=UPI00097BC78A|nr:arylamine N-acetyltransferase [Saccharothrix sp. ALI-22-I]ONI83383.1 arylamine N-acetyltransferase [Saccharothrix sp. ALI-22-I]
MAALDVHAFLRRLGLTSAERPSTEALTRLHQAFVERVPYETVEIQLGRMTSLDPHDSVARVLAGRGGYCFHLNAAFAELLHALGYHVTRHPGGVQMTEDDTPGITRNHLVLTVRDLPDSDDAWLVDAGLGDGLHSPLPLREGTYQQGPFTFGLRPSVVAPGGWRLTHDVRGSFLAMDFAPQSVTLDHFADRHVDLSTSPESGFVRTFGALRADGKGWDVLRALTLSRIEETTTKTLLDDPSDWFAALADVYGLVLPPEDRDHLWRKAVSQHEAHLATTP